MSPAAATEPQVGALLQRVVFPTEHDPDILPLYVDADHWSSIPIADDGSSPERGFVQADRANAVIRLSDASVFGAIRGRRGFAVPPQRRVSFGTYFNAFATSYWRKWTPLDSVVLRVRTKGAGQVLVYRSNARAVVQRMENVIVDGETTTTIELPFTYFGDGGWYWFDLASEEADFELVEAGWYAAADAPAPARSRGASIGITTLNRVEYLTGLLQTLGDSGDVLDDVNRIYVVDQGTKHLTDAPEYPALQALLGERLQVIEQPNIGGSGGFSRGMYETLTAGESDYVLLLDDDVQIEPESVSRAVRFANYASKPTLVGGHMFDMYDKSKLHAFAEAVDMTNFWWAPVTPSRHDFAASNLRQTAWMHRRIDAQYNGWWMCLIPIEVVEKIGLSLPVFIKWDDSEYGLRAAAAGYPTVSFPGAAVWHVSWVDKDDALDWQAFFHLRNRIVAGLLHSPKRRGGRLLRASLAVDMKHLFTMQYFAMAARLEAYRNVLDGPQQLHRDMLDRLPRTRALMEQYPDGKLLADRHALPEVRADQAREDAKWVPVRQPAKLETLRWLVRANVNNLLPFPKKYETRAQAHLAYQDARWWHVPLYDSVLVTNAEGSGALWYRRSRRNFFGMALESLKLRREIKAKWPKLRREYRSALRSITSPEQWVASFGIEPKQRSATKSAKR